MTVSNMTPLEAWSGIKPKVSHLRSFGCKAYAHTPVSKHKLDSKTVEYLLVGYCDETKAYRLFDTAKRHIIISRDVTFDESIEKSSVTYESEPPKQPEADKPQEIEQIQKATEPSSPSTRPSPSTRASSPTRTSLPSRKKRTSSSTRSKPSNREDQLEKRNNRTGSASRPTAPL